MVPPPCPAVGMSQKPGKMRVTVLLTASYLTGGGARGGGGRGASERLQAQLSLCIWHFRTAQMLNKHINVQSNCFFFFKGGGKGDWGC